MEFEVSQDQEVKAQGRVAKGRMLLIRVKDGDAWVQLEISQRELRLVGDGGAEQRRTWECEIAIPRVNERR